MLKYKDLTKGWDLEGGKQVLPFPPQGLLNNPPKGISCEEWTKVMGASEEWPIAGSEMGWYKEVIGLCIAMEEISRQIDVLTMRIEAEDSNRPAHSEFQNLKISFDRLCTGIDKHENRIIGGVLPFVREHSRFEEKDRVEKMLCSVEKSYKRKARLHAAAIDSMAKSLAQSAESTETGANKGSDAKTLLSALYSLKSIFDVLQGVMIVTMEGEIENAMYALRKHCQWGEWLANDEAGLAFRRPSSSGRLSDLDSKNRKMTKRNTFTSKSLVLGKMDGMGEWCSGAPRHLCFVTNADAMDEEADIIIV